jgi:hypothetical protein
MPPKKTRAQKDAAAAKQAERRRAIREAQTEEETRAELERLAQQQRELRALQAPVDKRRTSDRLDNANNSLK